MRSPSTSQPRFGATLGEVSAINILASDRHPNAATFERPTGKTERRDFFSRGLCGTTGCVGPVTPGKILCSACRARAMEDMNKSEILQVEKEARRQRNLRWTEMAKGRTA